MNLGDADLLLIAFERSRAGLALIDTSGVILRANEAGAAIIGRTPDEVVGIQLLDLLHPKDMGTAIRELARLPAEGWAGPIDLRVTTPDGASVWLQAQGTLLHDDRVFVQFDDVSATHELSERYDAAVAELRREHDARISRARAFADFAAVTARTTETDADALIRGIADVAIDHLADLAAVVLVDEHDPDMLFVAHSRFRDPAAEAQLRDRLEGTRFDRTQGTIGRAIDTGLPITEGDDVLHPDLSALLGDWYEENPIGQRQVYPMQSPSGTLGALALMRHVGAEPFSDADHDLAMVLASRTAVAVHNVRLDAQRAAAEAATERRRAQQEAVARLGATALSGASLDDVTDLCCTLLEETMQVPFCGVLIDDDHPDGLRIMAASKGFGLSRDSARLRLDRGLGPLLDAEGSVVTRDLLTEERYSPMKANIAVGIRSSVATQILSSTGTKAYVVAGSRTVDAFSAQDITFLEATANVIASAIDSRHALDDLRHNALHDALTGLPNRVLVLDRLELALEQASARGTQVAVLACDLDRFKVVNDGLGHSAGDEVLRVFADRLRLQVRPGDTVGRFGGDEFIIVCPDVAEVDAVVAIAQRLASAFSEPIEVEGVELVVSASIGIAFERGTGSEAAQRLLRDADAAMYRAKERGRARYELFDEAMRVGASHRLTIENELRRALDHDELVLHYQPIVDLRSGGAVGSEALVRWQHPERGLLLPAEFLDVADESGLILELGGWVFEEAARQAVEWEETYGDLAWWVAVNLAPRQLTDPRLLERIDDALERTGAQAQRLRVEITEDALIEDTQQVAEVLEELRKRDLHISVDDFGTGYSSLAYLKRLPLAALKLDRGFVAGLGEDGDDMVIAAAIIVMAQALGLEVVAEGVETTAQLEALRAMGCDLAQGWLFAKALPPEELKDWTPPHV
jgi:diguanylate cyclase (GGDEF)-like protein/PAS domain S-box-containing protein